MRKNVFILSGILVFFILIFGIIKLVQYFKKPAQPRIEIFPEKITEFTISSEKGTYRFKKEFDMWKINNYRCDKKLVEDFFEKVKNLKLTDIISENKDKWHEFEVDESSGIKVQLPNVTFLIGKIGHTWNQSYFRFADRNEIWLSKGLERYFIDKSLNDWRDPTILSLDRNEISEIEIDKLKKKKVKKTLLVKTSDYWSIKEDSEERKIEENKINSILDTLTSFYADGFAEEGKQLKNVELVVKVKTASGTNYEITIGEKENNKYLVKTNTGEDLFFVYEYKINNFTLLQKQKQ